MCDDEVPTVGIDNEFGEYKAGFAGDFAPKTKFPCIVGHHKYKYKVKDGWGSKIY